MKKARTKFLSLLLVLCMVVSMIPVAVFAADEATKTGTGTLVGGTVYTLNTDGVIDTSKTYLIVNTNSGSGYALTNSDGYATSTEVEIVNNTITVADKTNVAWTFSLYDTYGTISNNNTFVRLANAAVLGNSRYLTIYSQGNGAYRISYNGNYLRYYNDWSRTSSQTSVYLFEESGSSNGEAVTFTVTPGSVTLAPEGTQALTGTVVVGDNTYNLSELQDGDIEWSIAQNGDGSYATLSGTTVTGVADGSATVTATLKSVNGTAVADGGITLPIPVTVQSKTVVSGSEKLIGNDPVTTKQNVEPDFSNIKLQVTYDDGNIGYITTENGLIIEDYDITTVGYSYGTISYAGKVYGTVRVTVEGNPFEGKEDATTYPEYPEDGAVRIRKTATEVDFENTGVAQVELDVAGISVRSAVDVILVTDLSNSMAWAAGGRTDATSYEATKMYDLAQSVSSFADIFLAADEDGTATKNTMSLVTFGGYDADHTKKVYTDYADPCQTLLLGTSDASAVKTTINNIRVLGEGAIDNGDSSQNYWLSFDGGATYGENYGNTNYDHAFMQTADAIEDLKAKYKEANGTEYDASGRQIYILFMTDGAPSNYDGVYYQSRTGDRADVNSTWVNASGTETTYTMGSYSQDTWYQYIAGGTYDATTGTIPGNPLYWADQVYNTTSVANIYSIGFDIDNGGFGSMTFTEADGRPLAKVLENLVTDETLEVYSADDVTGLSKIYSDLATKIRYAGTNATVSDVVDSDFDLQLTQTTGSATATTHGDLGFKPTITIKTYELWTKEETSDTTLIGTRKTNADGSYVVEDIETVSFNDDGTEAYSDLKDGNIMTTADDGTVTIKAHYFTYTKTPEGTETFSWDIGNITDKEIALSFYAYLTGSMEGTCAKGLYYTNEEATLEYIDINDKHATKVFPVPAVAWGGASTAYEFYLVNEDGEPCDRNGNVIPFPNRIIITGPFYEELYLNQGDENIAKDIVAAYVLPAGYTLYDETAKYTVVTASGDKTGSLTISTPGYGTIGADEEYTGTRYDKVENEDGTVSYVESANGSYKKITAQTTIVVYPTDLENETSYIQTRVAFGVKYNEIPSAAPFELTPDKVVIDYGKEIVINITNDNDELEAGYTAELVGFSKYYDTVDLKTKFSSTSAIDDYEAAYGTFSIESNTEYKVRYKPTAIVNDVENIFCVIKMTNAASNDTYYMVDWLTVIPATIVYYETDFADGVFTKTTSGEAWTEVTFDGDAAEDGPQDDGTIGVGQTYGYDESYTNDTYLSNGGSWFVHGQGYDTDNGNAAKTYTLFSFEGTGFDLISRTGAAQGLIKVEVFSDEAMTNSEKTISVLNKSDSSLELYQIPVVSINDLTPGTHYVRVSVDAAYTSTIPALASLNRGDEFYFDAIRIYDPAEGDSVAEAAYIADGEAENRIDEVRAQLLGSDVFYALEDGQSAEGMVFVDTLYDAAGNPGGSGSTADVMTYAKIGPNNEVYLENGQAVAFRMSVDAIPASFDIGAKTITGGAAQLSVTVTKDVDKTAAHTLTKDVQSSTAQYYNVLEGAVNVSEIFADKAAYVVITNTGADVLSITDIKVAYGNTSTAAVALDLAGEEEAYDPYAVSYTADAAAFALARTVLSASEEVPEETIPEETEPEATEPEVTEPEVTEPETTEPEVTEPEITEPEVTEPEVTEPEATEPEATEPENNYQEEIYGAIKQIITGLSNLLNKWFK